MRKLVILMVAVALFGAGCGDDKKDTATTDTTTAASSVLPAGTPDHGTATAKDGMDVEVDNFYFGPNVIKATPGQTFKVALANEGGATHTFTIDSLGIDVTLAPEQKMDVTITAPSAAGTVQFYCRFHQSSSNMQGAILVA